MVPRWRLKGSKRRMTVRSTRGSDSGGRRLEWPYWYRAWRCRRTRALHPYLGKING